MAIALNPSVRRIRALSGTQNAADKIALSCFLTLTIVYHFYNTARNRENLSASGSGQNFESDWTE